MNANTKFILLRFLTASNRTQPHRVAIVINRADYYAKPSRTGRPRAKTIIFLVLILELKFINDVSKKI